MDLTPDQKALLERITGRFEQAYGGTHKRYRDKATRFAALYHNYSDWKDGLPVTDRRDRDMGLRAAKRDWGAELFIPYAFSTVETILARMLSNNPTMLILPRNQGSEGNVENIKAVLEAQQQQMDYPITLQAVCRDALQGGLGVQKTYWRKKVRTANDVQPRRLALPGESQYVVEEVQKTVVDDPWCMRVDPTDFIWDPFGDSMSSIEWCVHRTWRSPDYCRRMLEQGVWTGPSVEDVTKGPGGSTAYTEAWQKRNSIQGYRNLKTGAIHEVWEYHDGDEIITILDRQWIVQQAANPAWHGEMPFQVFRPTHVPGQMAGKGEIEPIEDLQQEINTLRSQRRDNATLVLQKAFFYADGMIDPEDFKFGPGKAIPTLGDPREAIFPVQIGDIPNSGYAEERSLQSDIERATGIDDTTAGAGTPVEQTATGAQLVQAAANLRIQLKARTCEIELVRQSAVQMLALDQQRILEPRDVRVDNGPQPGKPDSRWSWLKVGPLELKGEFDIDVEGGSMAPENVPQQRADARDFLGVWANPQVGPLIDPQQALRYVLKNMGIKNPEAWIQQQPTIPASALETVGRMLQQQGVDPNMLSQAFTAATNGQPQQG